jgi:hypothetical protein
MTGYKINSPLTLNTAGLKGDGAYAILDPAKFGLE